MKKLGTVLLVMSLFTIVPTLALAQMGHGGMGGGMMGGGMGHGQGMGSGMGGHGAMGQGMGSGMGRSGMGQGSMNSGQMPLSQSQVNSGAFRMLQQKTGMSATQLQQAYATSGARNFGQFASAMVVSKNLGLDSSKVLSGMQTQSLGQTLQQMGVSHDVAKAQIKNAQHDIKEAQKHQ